MIAVKIQFHLKNQENRKKNRFFSLSNGSLIQYVWFIMYDYTMAKRISN